MIPKTPLHLTNLGKKVEAAARFDSYGGSDNGMSVCNGVDVPGPPSSAQEDDPDSSDEGGSSITESSRSLMVALNRKTPRMLP